MADFAQYALLEHDIAFLKKKADEGNLVVVTGKITATGEVVAYTPTNAKTFYLYSASCFNRGATINTITSFEAELRNDGTVKDYFGGEAASDVAPDSGHNTGAPSFKTHTIVKGDNLVGNGSKKYAIHCTVFTNAKTVYGAIIGWIEDT